MLKNLQKRGITILVSTPYMDEATLCDQVALMQSGQILDVDSPKGITGKFSRKIIRIRSDETYRLINDLRNYEKAESAFAFGQFVHFTGIGDAVETRELEIYLDKQNHKNILTGD